MRENWVLAPIQGQLIPLDGRAARWHVCKKARSCLVILVGRIPTWIE